MNRALLTACLALATFLAAMKSQADEDLLAPFYQEQAPRPDPLGA